MAGETPPLLRCSHATGSACKLICRSHTRVFLFNYICMQYGRAGRACLCRAKPEQGVGCIVAHLQLAQGGVQLEPLGHRQHALQTRSFSLGQEAAWKLQPELGKHTAHAGPCCMGLEADWSRYQGLSNQPSTCHGLCAQQPPIPTLLSATTKLGSLCTGTNDAR